MEKQKCKELVPDFTGYNFHECGRPAKYVYVHIWIGRKIVKHLCGCHSRTLRRLIPDSVMTLEEYEKCPQN